LSLNEQKLKLPAGSTLVQILALCTDSESYNAQCYRRMDGQTDGRHHDANSRSNCVAVESAYTINI